MSVQWWRCRDEKRLIEFGWLWWDVPGQLIPNWYWMQAMAPLYARYGVLRTDVA